MADEIVWLRCKKCMVPLRLLAYVGGWGRYYDPTVIARFLDQHVQECYEDVRWDHSENETFFELVSFADLQKIIDQQPIEKPAEKTGTEEAGQVQHADMLAKLRQDRSDAAELLHAKPQVLADSAAERARDPSAQDGDTGKIEGSDQ